MPLENEITTGLNVRTQNKKERGGGRKKNRAESVKSQTKKLALVSNQLNDRIGKMLTESSCGCDHCVNYRKINNKQKSYRSHLFAGC